jgi:hypothetical protein
MSVRNAEIARNKDRKMKIKIVISSVDNPEQLTEEAENRSEVWSGELEILHHPIYITRIAVIAEGEEHPICDVPFSLGLGYYRWIPPSEPSIFGSLIEKEDTENGAGNATHSQNNDA